MREFSAALAFRTTLDQAGRVAGLAGELEVGESEVLRLLVDRQLARPKVLQELKAELRDRAAEREELVDRAIAGDRKAHRELKAS